MLVCLIAFPAAALGLASRQQALYATESKVLLNQQNLANSLTDTPDPSLRVDRDRLAKTQIEIAKLPVISERTLRALKITDLSERELSANVDVSSQAKTDLLVIRVIDPDPERAQRLATMYAAQYTVYRAQLDTAAINRTLREVNDRLDEKGGSEKLRDSLKEKQAQLRTLQTLQTKNSVIVRRADTAKKTQPTPLRDASLSLILGLMVGCALALVIDSRDSRLRDADDLAREWNAPLLGRIPAPGNRNGEASVSMILEPNGAEADAHRRVLSKIEFAAAKHPVRTLIAVSASDDEGRSEIIANLAVGFARAGRKVLAIDLDFLHPHLSQLFNATGRVGVSDVAVNRVSFEQTAVQIALVPAYAVGTNGSSADSAHGTVDARWDANLGMGTLDLLPSGSVPSNPSDFVGSPDLRALLERMRASYDIVLLDAPGLLHASDAARLCQYADSTIAIASIAELRRDVVEECSRILEQTPALLIGVVSTDDSMATDLISKPRGNRRRQVLISPERAAAES